MKSNQVLTLVDTGHTIKNIPHNLGHLLYGEEELIFLKKALSSSIVNPAIRNTAPVSVLTIVDDGTSISFLCYHEDGSTSLGLSRSALDLLEEAILITKKNFKKKKEEHSKSVPGWGNSPE